MKKDVVLLVVGLLALAPAVCAAVEVGEFKAQGDFGVSMKIKAIDRKSNDVRADLSIRRPGCLGDFSGAGRLQGNVLKLKSIETDYADNKCVITIVFDDTGKQAVVKEEECMCWHGASCGYEGKLQKK